MILAVLLFAVLVVRLHPDTPAARWLRDGLVERPLAVFARIERRYVIAALIMLVVGLAGVPAMTGELAWLMATDTSLLIDIAVAAYTLAAARGLRAGWRMTGGRLLASRPKAQSRPRPRSRRPRPAPAPAANDDADHRRAA